MLRAFELEERELDPDDPWNKFLQAYPFGKLPQVMSFI
jgi:hypothetical protein